MEENNKKRNSRVAPKGLLSIILEAIIASVFVRLSLPGGKYKEGPSDELLCGKIIIE